MIWDYTKGGYGLLNVDGSEAQPLVDTVVKPYPERVAGNPLVVVVRRRDGDVHAEVPRERERDGPDDRVGARAGLPVGLRRGVRRLQVERRQRHADDHDGAGGRSGRGDADAREVTGARR